MIASRRIAASGFRLAGAALLATLGCGGADATGDPSAVRVVFVDPTDGRGPDASAARGAALSAEEAERAGELVGRGISLVAVRAAGLDAAVADAAAALRDGAIAVIGGFEERTCRALDSLATAEGALYVNVGCEAAALRDSTRHPQAFHVAPTAAMLRGASGGMDGDDTAVPTLWHAGLVRYGAAQLNERFSRRYSAPMDGAAWAGWMGVKVVAEAALRVDLAARRASADTAADPPRPTASEVAAFLVRADIEFDGHKGEPLRFGADDRQLRQPLYAAGGAAPDERVPAATSAATGPGLPRLEDPSAPLLVVSNEGSSSLTVLDARTLRVAGVIPLGHRPRGVHASPDGSRVLVALSDPAPNAEGDGDAIVELDPRVGRVVARHRAGTDPEQFALSPDGGHLYAANEDAGLASVIDLRTGRVLASLPVGIEPEGVAVSPDGRWVYVTAETSNTVSVIDARENRVVASFLVDARPRAVAFSADGREAYVTNEISATVSIVDVARHVVAATVPLDEGSKPVGVVAAPDGGRVYVALGGGHAIAVLDPAARRVAATVPVGRRPWGVSVSPNGRWIYAANGGTGDISVVDAATLRVVATVPVGERPWGVAYVPAVR